MDTPRTSLLALFVSVPIALVGAASSCGGGNGDTSTGGAGSGFTDTGGAAATSSQAATEGAGGLQLDGGGVGGSGGMVPTCTPGGPTDDVDNDGYTPDTGDCDDCDPNQNPNAIEVPTPQDGDPFDENCDGEIDEVAVPCDTGLDVADMDPLDAAHAVELCKMSADVGDWGLVSAKWVMADGSVPPANPNFDLGHGMLSAFGANVIVRKGERMLGLSSGSARQPTDPGYMPVTGFDKGYTGNHPMGFPKESPACPGTTTGQPHDVAGVELTIRAPSNAHGFSFDFDFFTFEWPGYVCSQYNDFFVALLDPIPAMQMDGNIVYDSQGNPVSVNNAFLEVCGCEGNPPAACPAGGKSFTCALGDSDLIGTGFGFDSDPFGHQDHGSTSWLQTKAPIDPGTEITLRWAVYDSGDGVLDTTTLVDNFQWIAEPGIKVGTDPVPN
jgi:hypothetical protein